MGPGPARNMVCIQPLSFPTPNGHSRRRFKEIGPAAWVLTLLTDWNCFQAYLSKCWLHMVEALLAYLQLTAACYVSSSSMSAPAFCSFR